MHAVCQNLNTEEEVENVADIGFDCSMCRPYMPTSNGKKPAVRCCSSAAHCALLFTASERA